MFRRKHTEWKKNPIVISEREREREKGEIAHHLKYCLCILDFSSNDFLGIASIDTLPIRQSSSLLLADRWFKQTCFSKNYYLSWVVVVVVGNCNHQTNNNNNNDRQQQQRSAIDMDKFFWIEFKKTALFSSYETCSQRMNEHTHATTTRPLSIDLSRKKNWITLAKQTTTTTTTTTINGHRPLKQKPVCPETIR